MSANAEDRNGVSNRPGEESDLLGGEKRKKNVENGILTSDLPENSKFCKAILLINVITSVPMINYGLTCLNPAIPVIQEMYNETYYSRHGEYLPESNWQTLKALTMSIFVGGAFVGSICLNLALHFLRRKQCAILVHVINIIGVLVICLGSGISKAFEPMIVGRFLMGVANGLSLGLSPVIIGETCTKHRCARYDGLIGVCLAIGSLLGVMFGWSKVFGTKDCWPLIFVVPAIPSVTYLILCKWLPDTPQQVLQCGDREKFQKLMERLRKGSKAAISNEIRSMIGISKRSESLIENNEDCAEHQASNKDATLGKVMKTPQYRRQFIMVLLLFTNLMLNGINNVMFFSDSIFLQAGIPADFVTIVTIFVFLFQVIATLPGSYILRRFGSWILCIIGNIIMIFAHILVVASLATYEKVPGMSYLAIVGIAVFLLGFSGCENIAIFPLVGEITLRETRPICVNFGCATLWFTGWIVGFVATYFEIWMGAYSFLVWMGFTIMFTIYIVVAVPNTRNKTSEEIQKRFKRE